MNSNITYDSDKLIWKNISAKYDTTASSLYDDSWITNSYTNSTTSSTTLEWEHKYKKNIYTAIAKDAEYGSRIIPDNLAYQEEAFFTEGRTNTTIWTNPAPLAPGDRIRQMIRERMAPVIIRGRKRESLSLSVDIRETRARQTLRRVIGEQAFRRFIRDGFITVVPKSGLTYRIYPGHGMTDVYDRGVQVERLCVVLKGNFPPTDSLLMRYLLILNDEGEFSKYAVKHAVHDFGLSWLAALKLPDQRPLTEVWGELLAVA